MFSQLKGLDLLHDFLTGTSQLCHQVPIKISSKSENFLSSFFVYKGQCLQIGIGQMNCDKAHKNLHCGRTTADICLIFLLRSYGYVTL